MKFLIQKINGQIRHDFSFTLLESVRFRNWFHSTDKISVRFLNTKVNEKDEVQPFEFKSYHHTYVPIGSVEFVTQFLETFHNLTPKPINVPSTLFWYSDREIFNGTNEDLKGLKGSWVVKSNDKIKGELSVLIDPNIDSVPTGNYQISKYINIDAEWRCFVYKNRLVGLQHYVGNMTIFPNVNRIREMILSYKRFNENPIAYTLDVGINDKGTFVIEVHDFFSCGLYGFSDHAILPSMFGRWFNEYITKNKKI